MSDPKELPDNADAAPCPSRCSPSLPRPIFDCFVDREGVEYICEVYDAWDGCVECFGVYPLNEDGTKGEGILEDGFEYEVQRRYTAWIEAPCDDDVI